MTVAVMFPGQGAQRPGAGRPWVDHPAWSVVARAEVALERPLAGLLLGDSAEELSRTRNAQLAVLLTSLVGWRALENELTGPLVAWAGHSLGQVTALVASKTVTFEAGLRLAAARAEATQRAADARPGVMAALVGATEDQAADVCQAAAGQCWIANINGAGQVIIAGTAHGVEVAAKRAGEVGVRRVRRLDVGGAFHTPLMAAAAQALGPLLLSMAFAASDAPIVTNDDGKAHGDGTGWPERLARHLVSPVRWADCVSTMVGLGVSTFIEVGPGNALSGLIRRIDAGARTMNISRPADLPAVADLLGSGIFGQRRPA
jgi:[acyl-carrier-protein] S-malonyltransferase